MTQRTPTHAALVWLPRLVAVLGLLGLGFVAGTLLRPESVAASGSAPAGVTPGFSSTHLEQQMLELKSMLEDDRREARSNSAMAQPSPAGERRNAASTRPAIPEDLDGRLSAIEERLSSIERNSRILLARRSGQAKPSVRVPPGMAVRDFLQVLEDMDNDESTELHKLWTGDQILQAYGRPDRIEERKGYTEWIYTLDDDEQFDFHLTGGLVTLAH